jgi:hypothetical protein
MATVTRSDVQSVEGKLERFASELPEQERNVLGWLVARARVASDTAVAEEDLDANAAARHDLASALGFTDDFGDLTISWSKSFEPN